MKIKNKDINKSGKTTRKNKYVQARSSFKKLLNNIIISPNPNGNKRSNSTSIEFSTNVFFQYFLSS